eukprot:3500674-Rhodomonas_salina.1
MSGTGMPDGSISLRTCCAKCGTDIACACAKCGTDIRICLCDVGTDIAYGCTKCGTDIAYGAMPVVNQLIRALDGKDT